MRKRRAALADAAGTALAGTAPRQGSITQRQEKADYDGPVRVCVNGLRCQAALRRRNLQLRATVSRAIAVMIYHVGQRPWRSGCLQAGSFGWVLDDRLC